MRLCRIPALEMRRHRASHDVIDRGNRPMALAPNQPPPVEQHPQRPASTRADYTIEQNHGAYSAAEHCIWRTLFERQQKLLVGRSCQEFLDGISALGVAADGIPDFRRLNEV